MRQVRQHCERFDGRPIELKHIGLFYKANRDTAKFTFIPNEDFLLDGKLKLGSDNAENKLVMPKEIHEQCDGRAVLLNVHTIASVCDCRADLVQTFLNRFKQVMLELTSYKYANQMIINMRFGVLTINKLNGEIDFKTLHDSNIGPSGSLT